MKTLIVLAICIHPAFVQVQSKQDTLYVYRSGRPGAAMEECAKIFSVKNSIPRKGNCRARGKMDIVRKEKRRFGFWMC